MTQTHTNELKISVEKKLQKVLDALIEKRLNKNKDVWLGCFGDEGSGKTNTATMILNYVEKKTGRKLSIDNYFFDANSFREKGQSSKHESLNWDEGGLGGLSKQWQEKQQLYLMQFLTTGRIMNHFIIICHPRFWKMNEEILLRLNGMLYTYVRRNNDEYRAFYYKEKAKNRLLQHYKRKKKLSYNKFKSFGMHVPKTFEKVFSTEEQEIYAKKKIETINSIGTTKKDKGEKLKEENRRLKYHYATLEGIPMRDKAKHIGVNRVTLFDWAKMTEKHPFSHGST